VWVKQAQPLRPRAIARRWFPIAFSLLVYTGDEEEAAYFLVENAQAVKACLCRVEVKML
jgi:hypothetical protein